MPPVIPFVKMHGLGNDFVVIDELAGKCGGHRITPELARRFSDRHFGVGWDQLLRICRPQAATADARMEIVNADGSSAEMCGNGLRCVAAYLYRHGPRGAQDQYAIETRAGLKHVRLKAEAGSLLITADMGIPVLGAGEEIEADGRRLHFFEIDMGNPHAVLFVDDVTAYPVATAGPAVERHSRFPNRTNVEFVEVTGPNSLSVRAWERGAGQTLACGTGACAAAVAALATGRVSLAVDGVRVDLPGGRLRVRWDGRGQPVFLEGPAEEVFSGEYPIQPE